MSRSLPIDLSVMLVSLFALLCRKAGLSSKYPYSVMLRGEPLWWTGPNGLIEEIGGCYSERLVMASSGEEAAASALRLVAREVQQFARNPSESPICIEVEKCSRLDGFIWWHGRGFTFWPKEGSAWWPPRTH